MLENPVIVAAGWDKPGEAVQAWHELGCAGVEVGTVTQYPQYGNPQPRQFPARSNDGVVLNRLGFNGPGMEVVAHNLSRYPDDISIGVSVGKNKDVSVADAPEAHARVVGRLYDRASYYAINVSSPNTPGLRHLQARGPLTDIIQAVNQTMDMHGGRKPLFVKIAPDGMDDTMLDTIIDTVDQTGATGIIAANTTIDPELKSKYGWDGQPGGISGDDPTYRQRTTSIIRNIYTRTGGRMPIIGVGGVNSASAALEKIAAGASAVQIMTAIRQVGPTLPGRITRGIASYMQSTGATSMSDIIGSEARRRN